MSGVFLARAFNMPEGGPLQHADIWYDNYADEDGKLNDWHIPATPMGTE